MPSIPSKGWYVQVTEPVNDRTLFAQPLSDPLIRPSYNDYPEIVVPIPRSRQWQQLSGAPGMTVYRDGDEQPIDELLKATDGQDQIVLEGIGGVELRERVQEDYDVEFVHEAAESLINDHTTYTADVDTPSGTVQDGQIVQEPSTTAEFQAVSDIAATDPVDLSGDAVVLLQTAFHADGWDDITDSSGATVFEGSDESGAGDPENGQAAEIGDSTSEFVEYEFTTSHTIPEAEVGVHLRRRYRGADGPAFSISLNGTTLDSFPTGTISTSYSWRDAAQDPVTGGGWDQGDLQPGTHTIRVDIDTTDTDNLLVDRAVLADNTFSYNFDNSPTWTGTANALDGPELYPVFAVVFNDFQTPFVIGAGELTVDMDNTDGSQRIQISIDRGQTYEPDDGTEDNTSNVDVDFAEIGDTIRARVRLSRHEASGQQDVTPRDGYSGQQINSYELAADIDRAPALIDRSFDDSVANILSDMMGESFFWTYWIDDGTETVTVTQPGQRTADTDPALTEASITKEIEVIEKFTVKGANKPVSSEEFTAQTSFQDLSQSGISPNTESVYDPNTGVNYDRGTDYEMDWRNGQVRAVSTGDLSVGTTYEINYQHEVEGSFTASGSGANPRDEVVDIPEVPSSRAAEQIAYALVQEEKDPRWVGSVTIDPAAMTFNVADALALSQLDLPSSAGPFAVAERPEVTPEGTDIRLGSRPDLDERLADIRGQVSQLSRRA